MVSEEHELFLDTTNDSIRYNLKDIESNCLRDRSTLAKDNDISFFDLEARGDMHREVRMSLSESVILLDVMEVISSNNDGSIHLARDNHTLQDLTSDRHIASERTLLVYIHSINCFLRSLES
jgi:hypothetical protein